MTVKEALRLIQLDIDNKDVDWDSPLGKAYKMSFEALKRVKGNRMYPQPTVFPLLPGETKE